MEGQLWATSDACCATGECEHKRTGFEQSMDEVDFERSLCAAA
eukprot:CAMPEP_0182864788 /NCGR_PEP_ID=MMETSP0034_2-20130328/7349_1 /TAXON_ID=156128 /ORGANISM="Nephroselmis pyriformis, Strain CCMP717" /LENGTH=42 /DNA_ID= /DNA_START= /DNA_END= /DNA_ORIENTATION=